MQIPGPINEVVARTEQVAQESWRTAEAAGSHVDGKGAFLNAVRIAYLTGIQAAVEALGADVQAVITARRLDRAAGIQMSAGLRRRARPRGRR